MPNKKTISSYSDQSKQELFAQMTNAFLKTNPNAL